MNFTEFGLDQQLLEAISYMGFETATPIQEQAIPEIKKGSDIIGCAQTGTGKTAAFVLPILDKFIKNPSDKIKALIVVPTRELAIQIDEQIEGICYGTGISSLAIYGGGDGEDWTQQKRAFTDGVDIVIATPGKLIAHLNFDYVNFDNISHLVLDEADRMLDIGFHDDIMRILSHLPKRRQNLMFSATMPPKIRAFAKKILHKPFEINIAPSKPVDGVLQAAYLVYDAQKIQLIHDLIGDKPDYKSIIIFGSTKKNVSEIHRSLKRKKFNIEEMSSNIEQDEREEIMLRFRAKQTRILVATDVLSRGIDVKDINLVINYNVPRDAEDYVHRIGRTARAESTGVAITLINEEEMYDFQKIQKLIEKEILKLPPPENLGAGPSWKVTPPKKKFFRKKR
ncbi:MAG: ATP-dependent RNA helicase [Bacteroidetes bacterium]|nr:DEAD/DEAH box helicase [Sphingobacteriaceae bacterium AH-315-L07]PCH67634.1 MAG: ATP-dependent RNA helicase [Bacteroidota bacterium]